MAKQEKKITLSFEEEKLTALEFFMEQKDLLLESELEDYTRKLYEKHVPQQMRVYLERHEKKEAPGNASPAKGITELGSARQLGGSYGSGT